MFNFQTGQFCPVAFASSGSAVAPGAQPPLTGVQGAPGLAGAVGALTTLNIRSHSLDLSVLLLDVTTTGSQGVRARIASLQDISGTVETVYDADMSPWGVVPSIVPGVKGIALFYITATNAIQVPLSVEKLHFSSAVDKEVIYSWDGKCNSLAGQIIYPGSLRTHMVDFGKKSTVEALGQSWTFGRLELRVIEEFRDWVAEQEGDPFALVDRYIDKLPREDALQLMGEAKGIAEQLRNFSLDNSLGKKWLGTLKGCAVLIRALLRANHPEIDLEIAFQILQTLGDSGVATVIGAASGKGQATAKNG